MTIRARLFLLLTPPLIAFFLLASSFFYFHGSKEWLFIGSCVTISLIIGTVFFIADLISKPIRHLNQAALKIAAGDYETHLIEEGPKEIVELSNTFNTMSECLVENISRLKESSLIRERMVGEYECALLLQEYMLEKVIDNFSHPHLSMQLISPSISSLHKGLLLKINSSYQITLFEATKEGFLGLFELNQCMLQIPLSYPHIQLSFDENFKTFSYCAHQFSSPLVWSLHDQAFLNAKNNVYALPGPVMIFLTNSEIYDLCISREALEIWLARTLSHFAKDGLEIVSQMISKELLFLVKKQRNKYNLKMIALYRS